MAATYLARLLTGGTVAELHGRRVQRVSFQQAPAYPVDDLLITGADDGGTSRLELEIAVRRQPALTISDNDTEKLVGDFLPAARDSAENDVQRRQSVCVAGPQTSAMQLGELAALATKHAAASGFFTLIRTPGKFKKSIRDRLDHLVALVAANLAANEDDASSGAVEAATWQLLFNRDPNAAARATCSVDDPIVS